MERETVGGNEVDSLVVGKKSHTHTCPLFYFSKNKTLSDRIWSAGHKQENDGESCFRLNLCGLRPELGALGTRRLLRAWSMPFAISIACVV